MSARLLWLALLGTGIAGAQAPAEQVIRDCADRIAPDRTGLPALQQDCAALPAALQSLGLQPLLAAGSAERLDRDSLPQLLGLLHAPQRTGPDVSALPGILRNLASQTAHRSWWQRLEDWVAQHLPVSRSAPAQWLLRWLQRLQLSPAAARMLFYVLLAGLLLGAAAIVILEVRATRPAARGRRAGAPRLAGPVPESPWTLARLQREPPAARPALLFGMLAVKLAAAGRLPADRSLTHRELAARVRLEDPGARALWARLSSLAERQLYAATPILPADAESVLAQAQDLYLAGFSPLDRP